MPVAAYTDLLNTALDDLVDAINAAGVVAVADPRNIQGPCAFIDAPMFDAWNYNILRITWPIRLITLGPSNLDAQRSLMNLAAKLLEAKIPVTGGRPTIAIIGGVEYPAYDLTIEQQTQTS